MNRKHHVQKLFVVATCVMAFLFQQGCTKETGEVEIKIAEEPRVEDMSYGPVKMILTIDPPEIQLHKDALLVIKITHPSEIRLTMPDMSDRLTGFEITGTYDREPVAEDGFSTIETHFLLTPVISDEYRIAPIPVVYEDMSVNPAQKKWFPTRPVTIEFLPPGDGNVPSDINTDIKPVWIYPTFRTVALWTAAGILGIGIIWLVFRLSRRVREEIQLRRMSPRERALKELARLMAKHLPEKDMVKDFYLELTMIVRRYIERRHAIRAPEQTTEEFLEAVTQDRRFSPAVIKTLKEFLEAADLVKFAAHRPGKASIDRSTETARNYIISDDTESNGGEI